MSYWTEYDRYPSKDGTHLIRLYESFDHEGKRRTKNERIKLTPERARLLAAKAAGRREAMTEITMRAPEEIEAMCEEFFARLWYRRSLMFAADGKDSPKAEEARQRVALDYPIVLWDMEAGPEIPRGWMLGVVQALRWVLGDGERVEDASRDT